MALGREEALAIWVIEDGGPESEAFLLRGGPAKSSQTRYSKASRLFREGATDQELRRQIKEWSLGHIAKVRKWWESYEGERGKSGELTVLSLERSLSRLNHSSDIRKMVDEMMAHLPFWPIHNVDVFDLSSGERGMPFGERPTLKWVMSDGGCYLRMLDKKFSPVIEHVKSAKQTELIQGFERWKELGGRCLVRCHDLRMAIKEKAERETGLETIGGGTEPVQLRLFPEFSWTIYTWAVGLDYACKYIVAIEVGNLRLLHIPGPGGLAWVLSDEFETVKTIHERLREEYRQSPMAKEIGRLVREMEEVDRLLIEALTGFSKLKTVPGRCSQCPS